MSQIGSFIRKLRKEKNMSIRQLAKFTGVSAAYISQIENNYRKNPTPHVLRSLADGLGLNYNDFLSQINQLANTRIGEHNYFYDQRNEIPSDSVQKQTIAKSLDLYDILLEEGS